MTARPEPSEPQPTVHVRKDGTTSQSQGRARNYSWPPFEKGNTASVKHGLNSERIMSARAEQIKAEFLPELTRWRQEDSENPGALRDQVLTGTEAAYDTLKGVFEWAADVKAATKKAKGSDRRSSRRSEPNS